jgi:hypothetical protein
MAPEPPAAVASAGIGALAPLQAAAGFGLEALPVIIDEERSGEGRRGGGTATSSSPSLAEPLPRDVFVASSPAASKASMGQASAVVDGEDEVVDVADTLQQRNAVGQSVGQGVQGGGATRATTSQQQGPRYDQGASGRRHSPLRVQLNEVMTGLGREGGSVTGANNIAVLSSP